MCARFVWVGGRACGCVLWGVGWARRVGCVRAPVRLLGQRCVGEFGAAMRTPSVARLVCRRASEGRETRFYLVRNKMCHYVQVQVTRQHSNTLPSAKLIFSLTQPSHVHVTKAPRTSVSGDHGAGYERRQMQNAKCEQLH